MVALLAAGIGGAAIAGTQDQDLLQLKVTAEVQVGGRLLPADRAVSGDSLIYTVQARNAALTSLDRPVIITRIPSHMVYVADSAVGPGCEVSYSIDGGQTFDRAEKLQVTNSAGSRTAAARDYTHIRWRLRNPLKAGAVVFVRFRTVAQ